MQQVEVAHVVDAGALAGHDEAGTQERQIERPAVVGDGPVVRGEELGKGGHHGLFLGQVAHEVLADGEVGSIDVADSHKKCVGAGAAGEAGGFGVDEQGAGGIEFGEFAVPRGQDERFAAGAVYVVGPDPVTQGRKRPAGLSHEKNAVLVFDFDARQGDGGGGDSGASGHRRKRGPEGSGSGFQASGAEPEKFEYVVLGAGAKQ